MNIYMNKKLVLLCVGFFVASTLWAQENKDLVEQPEESVSQEISASSQVSGEVLEKTLSTNLYNTMIGRIPGLTVSQGSFEGGVVNNSLLARGISTFQGSSDPLLLIDGFQCSISELVPQEVESITLLKDAAATAIYGLRGANGVILVTTKRGEISPLQVSFSAQIGFQKAVRVPQYLDAYNYAVLHNEAERNDGVSNVTYQPEDLERYKSGWNKYLYPNVNWTKEIMRQVSPIQNYDLSFKGGNKIVKYFVMLNVINNNGLLRRTEPLSENSKNQSYTRYNVRSNIDVNVTKNFSVAANMGLSVADWTTPGAQYASTIFDKTNIPANAFPIYNPNNTFGGNETYTNPYADLTETGYYSSNSRTINTALRVTEKLDMITKGLSVSAAVAFNSWYIGYSNKLKTYARYPVSNAGTADDIEYTYGQKQGDDTSLEGDESMSNQWRNMIFTGSLDYKRTFGRHRVEANAQYTYESRNVGPEQPYLHIGGGARISYAYDKRYLLDLSAGYQGSERFPVGKQYGFFPAAAIGWVVSNEGFLKNNRVLPYLKLRASYGLTGNDEMGNTDRFMYVDSYAQVAGGYPFGVGNNVIYGPGLTLLGNSNFTWEKERKFNVGIEANILNMFDVSVDYFHNRRYDILAAPDRDIPVFIGANLPMLNLGRTKNQGFELSLRYSGQAGKNISYFAEFTSWLSKNEITYKSESVKVYDYQYTTGRPIFQPYVLIADGFYTQEEIDDPNVLKPSWSEVKAGDIKYKDMNNDGVIDDNDSYPMGYTSTPEFSAGLNLGATIYGFDISLFFHGVAGRTVYLGSNYYKAFQGNGSVSKVALGRWTPETAETATYPRLTANVSDQNNFRSSTFWQKNGDFLRLRNVEVGYTFKNLLKNRKSDLRVFISGNNLFTLDYVKDLDPELMSGYPAVATYSVGAKIQF